MRERFVYHNPSANIYRELLLHDGRIVGAVGPRWRQMLHGGRIDYGMLAHESAGR